MTTIRIIPPSLSKTKNGWRVGQVHKDKNYARYFHYKADAQQFMFELLDAKQKYGRMFTPEMVHMYEE